MNCTISIRQIYNLFWIFHYYWFKQRPHLRSNLLHNWLPLGRTCKLLTLPLTIYISLLYLTGTTLPIFDTRISHYWFRQEKSIFLLRSIFKQKKVLHRTLSTQPINMVSRVTHPIDRVLKDRKVTTLNSAII